MPERSARILLISSNSGWGGSEELWSAAAAELRLAGHEVTVLKGNVEAEEPRIRQIRALGGRIVDIRRLRLVPDRLLDFLSAIAWPLPLLVQAFHLRRLLKRGRFDLALLSQGGNLDGLFIGKRLRRSGIRYAVLCQKAAEIYWPYDDSFEELRALYRQAARCYFVSRHNLELTQLQLAQALPRSEVVRNPYLVPWRHDGAWPDEERGLRLACVGRLYPREKGQDILLSVLAREKWRARAVSVTFYGAGVHAKALAASAHYLGLENVRFAGFSRDVAAIWRDHHGLVLPSRCEGLPLVLVEAMLSGRVPIVTDVAGNAEMVADGRTGFLAAAPTDDALDEAMERAWRARPRWREIGAQAAAEARMLVPENPPATFAASLLDLCSGEEETAAPDRLRRAA